MLPSTASRTSRAAFHRLIAGILTGLLAGAQSVRADELWPADLTRFPLEEGRLVFTAGDDDDWDAAIRERGWILREGDSWRMWYTGYDGTRAGQKQLGLASSTDGIHWQRHPGNPIYTDHWVEDMQVLRHDGGYLMFAEGAGDRAQLLHSPDGVDWKRIGALDVRRRNGEPLSEGPYGTPSVFFEDGTWHLFYERRDQGVWLARSTDLRTFTNVSDEPVLLPGPGEYDRLMIALNQVIRRGDRYYAFYHGSGSPEKPRLWCPAIATSTDLVHWEKFPGNPLVPCEQNVSSGIVVETDAGLRFYTMHGAVRLHTSP